MPTSSAHASGGGGSLFAPPPPPASSVRGVLSLPAFAFTFAFAFTLAQNEAVAVQRQRDDLIGKIHAHAARQGHGLPMGLGARNVGALKKYLEWQMKV